MHRRALLIALLLGAPGCGIKGPLYIETPEQKKKAEERRKRIEAARHRDTQTSAAPKDAPIPAATTPPAAATAPDAAAGTVTSPDLGITDDAFGPSAAPH